MYSGFLNTREGTGRKLQETAYHWRCEGLDRNGRPDRAGSDGVHADTLLHHQHLSEALGERHDGTLGREAAENDVSSNIFTCSRLPKGRLVVTKVTKVSFVVFADGGTPGWRHRIR